MLQDTIMRLNSLNTLPVTLICNDAHRFIAAEQCREIGQANASIILEPVGRNTAPAIALAAFNALAAKDDALLLVLAADHNIQNSAEFCRVVSGACELAESGKLVTFGIVPNAAETGYGYIRCGDEVEVGQSSGHKIEEFVEKPNWETAQLYFDSGEFYWNSGLFLFKASTYLNELKQHSPDIYSSCEKAVANQSKDLDFVRIDAEAFEACPNDSIDYAIMEKTDQAVVVPLDAGWNDVGSFSALWHVKEKDSNGNACEGDVLTTDTKGCLILAENQTVTAVGLENLIVVSTKDSVLVADKDKAQNVKIIVDQLKQQDRSEVDLHREVYRPWGSYDLVDKGERFQVKRITVKPGAKLSVQMHNYRSEHWIVVSGIALVTNDDKEFTLEENQSTYIPVGVVHSLKNPGTETLELIEVQSGSYLGEDDIVHFEDMYGRV